MKILFYNHTGQVSGAERMLLLILKRIDRDGFDPIVVCPAQGPLSGMVGKLGVPVETIPSLEARFTWRLDHLVGYGRSFLGTIRQLRRKVKTINPRLLHANSIRAGLVATAATFGLGTRVVWHLHDMLPRHPLSSLIRLVALVSPRTRMIAVSQAVAINFYGGLFRWLKNRVGVILNAIDLNNFQPDSTSRRRIRKELRVREADPIIGIVGQLTPRKGQLELVRAFGRVQTKSTHSVLLVVGAPLFNRDHEYSKTIERTAAELGIRNNLRMAGARDDIGAMMQAMDLLVVNSIAEPFGLVILEAMASGTPVLAAAVDGIPEIITHGENGWLIPAQDEAALARAIIHLGHQSELCLRLADEGRRHVATNFSADRYLNELQAFYLKCSGWLAPSDVLQSAATSQPGAVATGLMVNCRMDT